MDDSQLALLMYRFPSLIVSTISRVISAWGFGAFVIGALLLPATLPGAQKDAPRAETLSRNAVAGVWEVTIPPQTGFDIAKAFAVLAPSGRFRLLVIAEVAKVAVSVGLGGEWQAQDRTLSFKVTESKDVPKLVGQTANVTIVSQSGSSFTVRGDDGAPMTLNRSHLPKWVPPEMNGPIALLTDARELTVSSPPPPFPSEAAEHGLSGIGVYRLHVDLRNGGVRRVEVERSSGNPVLDKAAMTGFAKWLFKAPLLRQLQRQRDPSNTSGESIFRVPWAFVRSSRGR